MLDQPGPHRPDSHTPRSASLVDLATMPDGNRQDKQDLVMDLVDNPVVPGAYTPLAFAPDELLRPTRSRLLGQDLDGRLHTTSGGWVQLA